MRLVVALLCAACGSTYTVGEVAASCGALTELGAAARPGVACFGVALDDAGAPFVAWGDESSGTHEVYLRRWDGAAWRGLSGSDVDGGLSLGRGAGGSDTFNRRTCMGRLAFDGLGRLSTAWMNFDGTDQTIYLRRWNGSHWEELNGSASGLGISPTGESWWPRLAVHADGTMAVAWTTSSNVYATRWDGVSWAALGGALSGPGTSDELVAIAAGAPGNFFLAWQGQISPGRSEIFLRQWDGLGWVELAGSGSAGGVSASGALAERAELVDDGTSHPVLAWQQTQDDGTQDVHLRRWNGAAWEALGGTRSLGEAGLAVNARRPSLALGAGGAVFIAWEQDEATGTSVQLARWTGESWVRCVGSDTSVQARASWPRLAASAGRVALTWLEEESAGQFNVYARVLDSGASGARRLGVAWSCSQAPVELVGLALALLWRRRLSR